tara:strand:- start:2058 stop:3896 length:1839 start_codon:yes stop_codon:yes gene_type:complete
MAQFNTTELDFDQIKTNLKNHFQRTGSAFADWDFEGSGLSSLLDVLAYNTHYNAVNAHMAMNESFLDSAQLRANVVSRAKLLGYTPSSKTASVAILDVTFTRQGDSALEYTLPTGTKFTTTIDQVNYTFQTLSNITAPLSAGNKFVFTDLKIYQSTRKRIEYVVDDSIYQKFIIDYNNVDISQLTVEVFPTTNNATPETYTKFSTFTNIDSTSKIYFLHENGDGYYNVTFGDGVLGKSLSPLDTVRIDFITTVGAAANGARLFTYASGANATITGTSTITLKVKSQGGEERESLASIKYNAPLSFVSQNRAVTAEDYKTLIRQNITNVKDVAVWGGQDNDIPNFGEVNISIRPLDINQLTLTDAEKDEVEGFLDDRKVVAIKPRLRDPLYTFLYVEVFFKYNLTLTNKTKQELETDVRNSIVTFNENNLNNFSGVFRYSTFLKAIDQTNAAILNSVARIHAYKKLTITVTGNESENDSIDFAFAFDGNIDQTESMISSTSWLYSGSDVQLGDEKIVGDSEKRKVFVFKRRTNGTVEKIVQTAGYLYPATGVLQLNNLPSSQTTEIKVKVRPASDDILAKRREVLSIDLGETQVGGDIDGSFLSQYTTVSRDK